MTTQHSPWPWTVAAHTAESPDEITPGCYWTIYGEDLISVCFEGGFNHHAAANVRLIVAAPELLEALIAARKLWGDYLPPGNSNAMKAMKLVDSAIAKATGETAVYVLNKATGVQQ